jgi:hypothetical protein
LNILQVGNAANKRVPTALKKKIASSSSCTGTSPPTPPVGSVGVPPSAACNPLSGALASEQGTAAAGQSQYVISSAAAKADSLATSSPDAATPSHVAAVERVANTPQKVVLTDVSEAVVTAIVDVAAATASSGRLDVEANFGKATVINNAGKLLQVGAANRSVERLGTVCLENTGTGSETTTKSVASAVLSPPCFVAASAPVSPAFSLQSLVLPTAADKSSAKRKANGSKCGPFGKSAGASAAHLAAKHCVVADEVVTPRSVFPESTPGPSKGTKQRNRPSPGCKKKAQKSTAVQKTSSSSGESRRQPHIAAALPTVKKPSWVDIVDKSVWQSSPPSPRNARVKSPRPSQSDFLPDKFDTIKQRRQGSAVGPKKTSKKGRSPLADVEIRECCVKIYRDPQLLGYVPIWFSSKKKKTQQSRPKNRIKEAFILSDRLSAASSPASVASPLPIRPDLAVTSSPSMAARERRPSVCSGVDPQQPLFAQIASLPRKCLLDFDSLSLSDDFSQLISSPQFESLVQSFVMLKQRTLEVRYPCRFFTNHQILAFFRYKK